jgi:Toprim-like/Protein of unknown function (DUF3991)
MFNDETQAYKTRIDLRSYAAGQGYVEDRRQSYSGLICMRHASGDKIYIKQDLDGHYLYWSIRDDGGSIVDFVANRKGLDLKHNRKDWRTIGDELRPWLGMPPVPVPSFPPMQKTRVTKDRAKVEATYARMQDANGGHSYLERERALPGALLALDRLSGRVRIDDRGNAVFPHFDLQGLSGYELKNTGFTGFSSGGSKALWLSHEFPDDKRLVICESAIDALSHATLFPDNHARYASVGGKVNSQQPELIRVAVARMPVGSEIISAMDADAEGRKLAEVVRHAVELSGRLDLKFTVQEPVGHKDWNDQLRAKPHPLLPYRPQVPSVA